MIHQSTRRRVWDKLLESLGSAEAGAKPISDLSRGATIDDIVAATALALALA